MKVLTENLAKSITQLEMVFHKFYFDANYMVENPLISSNVIIPCVRLKATLWLNIEQFNLQD